MIRLPREAKGDATRRFICRDGRRSRMTDGVGRGTEIASKLSCTIKIWRPIIFGGPVPSLIWLLPIDGPVIEMHKLIPSMSAILHGVISACMAAC
jgi:hypothetical protein